MVIWLLSKLFFLTNWKFSIIKLKHLYDTDLKRKADHTIKQIPKMNAHNEKIQMRNKRNTIIEKILAMVLSVCCVPRARLTEINKTDVVLPSRGLLSNTEKRCNETNEYK